MSRHRIIRKMKLEDELDKEEDMDDFEDDEPLSPDSSQFIYQRTSCPMDEQNLVRMQPPKPIGEDSGGGREQRSNHQMDDVVQPKKIQSKQAKKPRSEKLPVQTAVEHLRLSEASPSRANSKSPARAAACKSTISNMEMAINAPLNYKKRERIAENMARALNLVIVGHVDAGKSTLIGHLLYLLGTVEERLMHKYRQESSRIGKSSFAFAWILDESEEERKRGVTMDIARTNFMSPSGRNFNILDAPGHKDFIPNMFSGSSQADAALLVLNATRGEFETGFDQGGQTREHALLIRALGISRIIVAVNKLDTVDWSKERYDELCAILSAFLQRRVGFEKVTFIPVSGLLGINLTVNPPHEHLLNSWYQGQTLIEALDAIQLPSSSDEEYEQYLRIIVNDVLRFAPQNLVLSCKMVSGHVEASEKLWIMPEAVPATVKTISIDGSGPTATASPSKRTPNEQVFFAGDQVTLTLSGAFEPDTVFPGHALSRGGKELLIPSRHFSAKIVTFDIQMPILKGTQAELFIHSLRVPCVICHLRAIHPGVKAMEKRNPRLLPRNVPALVEIQTDTPINVETFKQNKTLGRIALRAQGQTIAAGIVEECFR